MHTSLTLLHHVSAHGLTVLPMATTSPSGSGSSSHNSYAPFLVLLALFGVAYFLFLRPARNRQRAAVEARRETEVGDEVITTAGLIATVVAIEDDFVTLEVAPGVRCRYVPAAILRVNRDEAEDETGADDDEESEDHSTDQLDATTHEVIEPVEGEAADGTTDTPGEPTPA